MSVDKLKQARDRAISCRKELVDLITGEHQKVRQQPEGIGDQAARLIRDHPLGATGAGMALGVALAAYQEPIMKEVETRLREFSSSVSTNVSTAAQTALTASLGGLASEFVRRALNNSHV